MMMIDYELWIELNEKKHDRFAAITNMFSVHDLKRQFERAPARCRGRHRVGVSAELVESGVAVS